jgi:hypothetical protein
VSNVVTTDSAGVKRVLEKPAYVDDGMKVYVGPIVIRRRTKRVHRYVPGAVTCAAGNHARVKYKTPEGREHERWFRTDDLMVLAEPA